MNFTPVTSADFQWAFYGALLFWEEQLAGVSEHLHKVDAPSTPREELALNYGRFCAFADHRFDGSLRADDLITRRFGPDDAGVKGPEHG